MRSIQNDAKVTVGLLTDLPNPAEIPQGYFFFATDSVQLFVLAIDAVTQGRTWDPVVGAGSLPGIPFDQVALGNLGGTGLTSTSGFKFDPATNTLSHEVPANPQYFVSSTGSNTNAGTLVAPLATVAEALRRLKISSWSGQPIVTVVDTLASQGVDVKLSFPQAPANASPILLAGTTINVTPGGVPIAPTGGTTGTALGPGVALATVTSTAVTVANAFRGKFMRFVAGALNGQRAPITSNDGAGGFVINGTLSSAPGADPADRFIVEDVPAFQSTGTLHINSADAVIIDSVEFSVDTALIVTAGTIQPTAVRIRSIDATPAVFTMLGGASWRERGLGNFLPLPPYPLPAGLVPCGCVFDGGAGQLVIGDSVAGTVAPDIGSFFVMVNQSSVFRSVDWIVNGGASFIRLDMSALCSRDSCGMSLNSCAVRLIGVVDTNMRKSPGVGSTAVMEMSQCTFLFNALSSNATVANSNIVRLRGSSGQIAFWVGLNPAAGIVPLDTHYGTNVQLAALPAVTGTVPGNDCTVGANAVNSWANVFTVAGAVNTTDFNAGSGGVAASQGCRVGP